MGYKDAWKANNIDKHREHSRRSMEKWRNSHPNKVRAIQMMLRNGLSVEDYEKMLAAQKSVCAIYAQPETTTQRNGVIQRLSIDHDHRCCPGKRACGKCIRKLLCSRCNIALGMLNEDVTRMKAMIAYVRKTRC